MSVRVRYAPSPTGSPHVGNIRTALYNFLFARKNGGVNILRIEDTDRTRLVEGCEDEIIESLNYVGIKIDEGVGSGGAHEPYRQSERKEAGIYSRYWQQLLDKGAAYWAFDTPEELAEMREFQQINKQATGYFGGTWREATSSQIEAARNEGKPGVIRLKIPRDELIVIEDAIRGRIEYDSNVVDDPVLIKADGMPTYHFAAMVDDHLMDITHIFRGEEWISSAPKHVQLFKAFGWTPPVMVHLPVIKGKDGSKLSKRHGDTACLDFRRAGFLGHVLANFIALIGWSPGGDREVMSIDEMAEAFDIKGIQPSSGVFDFEKLIWMSGVHIRQTEPKALYQQVRNYANAEETETYWSARVPGAQEVDPHEKLKGLRLLKEAPEDYALEAVKLEQERVTNLADFGPACLFFFVQDVEFDSKAVEKWFQEPHVENLLLELRSQIGSKSPQSPADYEEILREAQVSQKLEKFGSVVHPTRVATTGKTVGPGLFELLALLGQERIIHRLDVALQKLHS